jgi:hypothetical protein
MILISPSPPFTKHGEVAQKIEESALLENTLDQRRQFRHSLGLDACAVGGAPGHEAFAIRRQRADPRRQAVGGHQQGVAAEQRWDLLFVGLKLIERASQGRVLAARRFQFHHRQRQAVHEDHHVRPAL